jgi:hypothetical protein
MSKLYRRGTRLPQGSLPPVYFSHLIVRGQAGEAGLPADGAILHLLAPVGGVNSQ